MSLLWKPAGPLDLATAATDLPEVAGQGGVVSTALAAAKNLRLDRKGMARTRNGSKRLSTALSAAPTFALEARGVRYAFAGPGVYRNETLISSESTGTWSAIRYNAFNDLTEQTFAANGVERLRIDGSSVYEWGIAAPSTVPGLEAGTGSALTGTYYACYTYSRKVGSVVVCESNPSNAAWIYLSAKSIKVTPAQPTDTQVTHIRIYRTLAGGQVYYHDQDIAVGTTYLDSSTTDGNLGTEVSNDHDRPPSGISKILGPIYNGLVFGCVGNKLYWCAAQQPEYWPATQYVEVGSLQLPIRSLINYTGQLYALTDNQIWFIQGTGANLFHPISLQANTGCPSWYGAIGIEGHGIYHVGADGIYCYTGGRDTKITQATLDPLFRGESVGDMPAVTGVSSAWLWQYGNRLFFHYGTGSVLVMNLDTGGVETYQYDQALYAPATDWTNSRFLAYDGSYYPRVLDDVSSSADPTSAIAWTAQSKDFTLQTRAHFPRWAKYDVDGTATAQIYLSGAVHQTHSLSVARDTRHRLIDVGNGKRCSLRLTGTGTATIYAVEME